MALAGFLILCIVWGTSWVAIKYSLEGFPPFLGATLRFGLAAVLLIVYGRWKSIPLRLRGQPWKLYLVTGFLIYALNYGLIYWAEQHLKAGVTSIVFATFPLFVSLLSNFAYRSEPFRYRVYIGLTVGFLGVFLTFSEDPETAGSGPPLLLPTLAVLTSSVAAALSSVIVKKHLSGVHPVSLTLHQLRVGIPALGLISLLAGEFSAVNLTFNAVLAVIYLGAAASAFAFVLYYWLLQRWSAVSVSLLVYFNPLVALLFGRLFLAEELTPGTLAGCLLVFSGVLMSQAHHYKSILRKPFSR